MVVSCASSIEVVLTCFEVVLIGFEIMLTGAIGEDGALVTLMRLAKVVLTTADLLSGCVKWRCSNADWCCW